MTKKELLEKLAAFDDCEVLFSNDKSNLLHLDTKGAEINEVAEINNGIVRVIVLLE